MDDRVRMGGDGPEEWLEYGMEEWFEDELYGLRGRYALVLELDGFEFLIDPRHLRKPPRVLVRRGERSAGEASAEEASAEEASAEEASAEEASAEVWLFEDDVSLLRPSDFSRSDVDRVLGLVREHLEELLDDWYHLREDMRRGRLGRNLLVY